MSYIHKLINRYFNKEKIDTERKDNFERFYYFLIDYTAYYIPCDLSNQHSSTNEDLSLYILNKEIEKVLKFDYSYYEESYSDVFNKMMNYLKEKAKKSHRMFLTEEDRLKRSYSNFHPNRDYSDKNYNETLKRPDDINGEYIDNGYR